ncbi:hypothetical protein PV10_05882 [Exophiala mesophila]|uniref:Myb-like DNA-binding domain-containing protein n=1 Tax=Exophiala mesophila TaxID=212818 RepID=A0A0D1ZBH4_EXOME|nr:uncharacterized protein PV10_05882 [Exophiala mesophila]KIV91334.1 hypothetical protein PV10_05882 [Exophiala mesophila]
MPPKTTVSPDAFLAACIKHAKEKVVVNFDALAQEVGMSSGGAANKYRLMMKQLEEQGAAWASNKDVDGSDASPSAKPKPARKRKAAPATAAVKENGSDDEKAATSGSEDTKAPKKKAKTTTNAAATAPKKARKEAVPKTEPTTEPKPEPEAVKNESPSEDLSHSSEVEAKDQSDFVPKEE